MLCIKEALKNNQRNYYNNAIYKRLLPKEYID